MDEKIKKLLIIFLIFFTISSCVIFFIINKFKILKGSKIIKIEVKNKNEK